MIGDNRASVNATNKVDGQQVLHETARSCNFSVHQAEENCKM
jgi:hypothetical protein